MINLYDEIKQDILTYDFDYIEYNDNDHHWNKSFIIDEEWLIWYYTSIEGYFAGKIEKNRFMTMDKKAVMQLISSDHYYNFIPWDDDEEIPLF